ncbi:MAG: BACON domain-containing protein, partial [Gemmatimonadales bacterium]
MTMMMTMMTTMTAHRLRAWLGTAAVVPVVVLAVTTCRLERLLKPNASRAQPVLRVAPTSVRDSARAGSDDTRRVAVEITSGGSGDASFEWSADEDHGWIRLSPREGTVPDTLTISLDPEDLDPGTHEGIITITASDPPDTQVTIAVTFVTQRAALQVSPPSLEHATNVNSGATFSDTVRVNNGGSGPLVWTARNDRSWVRLGREAGSDPGSIPLTINSSGLPAGTHRDEIVVTAPGATGSPARIDVTLTIFAPGLAVSPASIRDTVTLGAPAPRTHALRVTNSGSGSITWSATKRQPWVSLSHTGGGAPDDLTVTVTPAG